MGTFFIVWLVLVIFTDGFATLWVVFGFFVALIYLIISFFTDDDEKDSDRDVDI